jgi:hypothetical protein
MEIESLQARMEHEQAELRAFFPHIEHCHTALVRWSDAEGPHHSLCLDIRWPQHQTLVSGPARDSAEAAVEAGFAMARQRVRESAWAVR